MNAKADDTRDKILDAAQDILVTQGAMHLTLDAVAQKASLSKGGLLYHFKSKEDMMVGLIHRQIAGMNQELKDQVFNDPEPRGRFARAYLNVAYQKDECENPSQKLCSTLIAVIANNPKLLEPILTQINSIQERLQNDGLDPTSAFIIRLIGDGIWFNQMLGIPVDPDMIANVLQRVQEETGSCL